VLGTGKTTVARKIGKVYYDMGFLASDEVIDCSASDLVGQYVGHTGPLVRKQFDKALGKVYLSLRAPCVISCLIDLIF
jgi:SpoVK/Ycf46/Vps4 family AAA+-type ATPase